LGRKERIPSDEMQNDTVKFFQAFISQMIMIGGNNLPKTIAIKLGGNLGGLYRNKGVNDWKVALKGMLVAMGGDVKSIERDGEDFFWLTEFQENSCPIGGKMNKARHAMFKVSVCEPYIKGFLNAFESSWKCDVESTGCILKDGGKSCAMKMAFKK
jgi:hypothetical protein